MGLGLGLDSEKARPLRPRQPIVTQIEPLLGTRLRLGLGLGLGVRVRG